MVELGSDLSNLGKEIYRRISPFVCFPLKLLRTIDPVAITGMSL